jgi:hypothetical protein
MALIPPTISNLANSKKAVTFWVILALFLPMTRDVTGLTLDDLMWITIGYVGYAMGQGLKDLGLALAGRIDNGSTKPQVKAPLKAPAKK